MYIEENKLKSFMIDSGLVSDADIQQAETFVSKNPKQSIGDFLISEGKISDDDLKRVQAYLVGIPFIDISSQKIPFEILSIIPEPIARNRNIIAYGKDENRLEVAMLDTDDLSSLDFIKKKTGFTILPRLTSSASIKKALIQYQKSLKADFGDLIKKDTETMMTLKDGEENEKNLLEVAQDLPVVRIVDTLLKHAILQNASDIHIEPQEADLLVRYRVDGILHEAMNLPKQSGLSITARIKVLASLKIDEKRLPQ
ncbi:MAG: Flp pilus assembly complex ATPase component TadA, partial [Candidatus Pacebacteria bacterium]|nr:Flp pilus assembly complex ATPase component TadA [Candidatus Paceibacterota bacterium]